MSRRRLSTKVDRGLGLGSCETRLPQQRPASECSAFKAGSRLRNLAEPSAQWRSPASEASTDLASQQQSAGASRFAAQASESHASEPVPVSRASAAELAPNSSRSSGSIFVRLRGALQLRIRCSGPGVSRSAGQPESPAIAEGGPGELCLARRGLTRVDASGPPRRAQRSGPAAWPQRRPEGLSLVALPRASHDLLAVCRSLLRRGAVPSRLGPRPEPCSVRAWRSSRPPPRERRAAAALSSVRTKPAVREEQSLRSLLSSF